MAEEELLMDDDEYEGEEEFEPFGEEQEEVEEESILTEYDPQEFTSGAVTTADSTIPQELFDFENSYGYDCHKYFNLCPCDETVVCWATGSYVTFLDVETKQTWFRRTSTGGSVGNITSYRTDPNYRIAIAEGREGAVEPVIILYTWPQMEIDAVLRDGTANSYSIMDFSPDGEMLASVGREPDYNLTIWNWKRHRILLRTSAFTYDVNAVLFSPYCPGQLTTAGAAHIKFWKMASTFTGLKLKGELGRFGKTEICDVLGVYPMPDEKVLSGCEWGNILVWEAGLVKLEVTQRGRKRCHLAPIIQFMLSPAGDEVTTIARDGCIRAWYWDTVEQADPPEDDLFVELNPVAETCVPNCQIMSLKQQSGTYWFAQDANGGVWIVDLELDKLECEHKKVLTSHAGAIVAMAVLRTEPVLITVGEDGALQAYNIETFDLLTRYVFSTAVTCLFYPPIDVDDTSKILMLGFADGIIRTLFLYPEHMVNTTEIVEFRVTSTTTTVVDSEESLSQHFLDLISVLKPHSKAVNQITINEQRSMLVTCSADSTLFLYKLIHKTPFELERLGFIDTPNNIAFMQWKPNEERVLLLCGQVGLLMEVELPEVPVRKYTEITTFKLDFVSYTETLVRKHFMRHRPFPEEEDLASIDEEALKAKDEADKDDDEEDEWVGEIELMESESMLGTTITWAEYCEDGCIWVVQRGTGALLLVKPGVTKILKYAPIPGAWCDDITSLRFICDKRYLLIGTNTGYIRVVRMPTEDEDNPDYHVAVWMTAQQKLLKKLKGRRLAKEETQPIPRIDFIDNYYLAVHDFYTGAITCFAFNNDATRLYTCGNDGNIFSFVVNFPEPLIQPVDVPKPPELEEVQKVKEPSTLEGELMSHEQLKQKEEYDKMMSIANAHKKRVRDQLSEIGIEYNKLIKANRLLPVSQQIDVTLDPRPLVVLEEELSELKALTVRKLAHQLEASDLALHKMYSRNIVQLDVYPFVLKAIRDPEVVIRPLRQKNLSKDFYDQLDEVHQKMAEAALRGRPNITELLKTEVSRAESVTRRVAARRTSWGPPRVASFLLGLPPKQPHPLKKALRDYHTRLRRHHIQLIEWQEHLARKPDANAMPPGAAEALKEAESTIGNRLLKTQPDYVAPPGHNTQLKVCMARKEIYDTKREFNEKVLELREHKLRLVDQMKKISERLGEIRVEIPPKKARPPPPIPHIDDELEFPEKNLEVKPEVILPGRKGKKSQVERRKSTSSGIYPTARVRAPRVPKFVTLMETKPLTATWELFKVKSDTVCTPVEIEIRERRIMRNLYEQDMLIAEAEQAVHEFDSRLRQLQRERIRVQERSQLLELHLWQLHREMNVLNRFEAHEDRLAQRVYTKLMQVKGVQDLILDCEHRIEDHKGEKVQLDEACQELHRQFKKVVQDNKFADFLRRIFKKKYKPPKDHDDDDESESESESSSSEEEDEGSIDSRDIGPIRLDPNICPEGCDLDIYNKTYELRDMRHKHEQEMIEQDKLIDMLRRDIDIHNKNKRKLSLQLDKRKNELREFMMEKQSCLNEVEQVVILRYDQIRASVLAECAVSGNLAHAVVFPERQLARLRDRVHEIQSEIEKQKQTQKINKTHLHRMNIDLKHMEARAEELKAQMRDVLTKKLGKPRRVDKTLDDLLRQMAKKHKFTANLAAVPQMLEKIRQWKNRNSEYGQKYLAALQKYSEKLRLAAALQADVLPAKPTKDPTKSVGSYSPEQYKRDVVRLRIVHAQQLEQIEMLESEIEQLRLKPTEELPQRVPMRRSIREREMIDLIDIPHTVLKAEKYFPITPVGSVAVMHDVNIKKMLFDCLDVMRVNRDEADNLLRELTKELPSVLSGTKTRYEVVDAMVRRWLLKHGGDPAQVKKQTKAFDSLAALADRLVKQHIEAMEGSPGANIQMMSELEEALREVVQRDQPLAARLGPTLAALVQDATVEDIVNTETMTSLVNALVDEEHPITTESIEKISIEEVIQDMRDCGVIATTEDLLVVVQTAVASLRAQLVSDAEQQEIDGEVEHAFHSGEDYLRSGASTATLASGFSKRPGRASRMEGSRPPHDPS